MAKQHQRVKLTLLRSTIGRKKNHQDCVRGLGLRKIRDSVEIDLTPENRGMVNAVSYLLSIQEV
jgi:large subunit ribosomal protein L30